MIIDQDNLLQLQQRYQHNFMRPLLALSHYFRAELMHYLQNECGHTALKITWEPLLNIPGSKGIQIGQLAKLMAVSKQNCDQQLKAVEQAGYLHRISDPSDGRAKLVALTERGQQLLQQGKARLDDLQHQFDQQLSQHELSQLQSVLSTLTKPRPVTTPPICIASLIELAALFQRRLMALTIASGHPGLQMSYEQVLNHIGMQGATIAQLAQINNASKQAITRIINALEDDDYVKRITQPSMAKRIVFTHRGLTLIDSACDAIASLKEQAGREIGDQRFKHFEHLLWQLHSHFVTTPSSPTVAAGTINIDDYNADDKPQPSPETLLLALATALDPTLTETDAAGNIRLTKDSLQRLEKSQINSNQKPLEHYWGQRRGRALCKQLAGRPTKS
ncbi:hypothetical protein SIN8267_01064 [Sinobacterium norvegicum]|uniref:HTH marR-type domain-containing protein n=1 Tax=Sinobacterium norvegicum TaxID=1641715 RepID=A0ABN8EEY8_9GAMM|nr:MarR family transcriptional regulator [Sinobacterium norvegicum]CAH0990963.1 hypothetical protein SIN8267_01064 [Sinobacterium norvegicum]